MIVLDASAALELLAESPLGERIAQRLRGESLLHGPHLLDIEVVSVLRRQAMLKSMTPERALQAIRAFVEIPIKRYPHAPLLGRVWELRQNLSAYDACYAALAEILDATLLTCDMALNSVNLRRGKIEVIKNGM